jgi:hypothetical protein
MKDRSWKMIRASQSLSLVIVYENSIHPEAAQLLRRRPSVTPRACARPETRTGDVPHLEATERQSPVISERPARDQ